jgi:hypothetical protein
MDCNMGRIGQVANPPMISIWPGAEVSAMGFDRHIHGRPRVAPRRPVRSQSFSNRRQRPAQRNVSCYPPMEGTDFEMEIF